MPKILNMNKISNKYEDLKKVLLIVWTIISIILTIIILSPFFFNKQTILELAPTCLSVKQFNVECAFCGMTRAFIEIINLNFNKANTFNGISLYLYFSFLLNTIIYFLFINLTFIKMKTASLILGILALVGLFVGFIPCIGALNWINIPFAFIGLIISIIAITKVNSGESKSYEIMGIVFTSSAIVFGLIRLILGGGIV